MSTTATKKVTNSEDVIDLREVTDRVEYLEEQPTLDDDGACYSCGSRDLKEGDESHESDCEVLELQRLNALLDELRGNGGDHDWRGDWYPLLLVRDSYFEDFARQEAEDLDLIKSDASWPYTCIDWERAAQELQSDYGDVEFDGVTYWYR